MSVVSSICCYCGTGCGVPIEADASKITGVRGAGSCGQALHRFFGTNRVQVFNGELPDTGRTSCAGEAVNRHRIQESRQLGDAPL
jgi:hypothetical protein